MVGAAAFMNWRGGIKTAHGIFWFAVAGVLGWPFASALCAPYLLEELVLVFFSDKDAFIEAIVRVFRGVVAGLIVVVSGNNRCEENSWLTLTVLRLFDQPLLLQEDCCHQLEHCQVQHILFDWWP